MRSVYDEREGGRLSGVTEVLEAHLAACSILGIRNRPSNRVCQYCVSLVLNLPPHASIS